MNKLKKTVMLLSLITVLVAFTGIVNATTIPTAPTDPDECGGKIPSQYEITLASVTYDPEKDIQTWTYNIQCLDGHGVSHVNFEFDEICDPPLSNILDAGSGADEISDDYTDYLDGNGGFDIAGLKIDVSVEEGETKQIWFILRGEWPTGTITSYIKADGINVACLIGEVAGPECTVDHVVPEVPLGSVVAGASMVVAFGAYFAVSKKRILAK